MKHPKRHYLKALQNDFLKVATWPIKSLTISLVLLQPPKRRCYQSGRTSLRIRMEFWLTARSCLGHQKMQLRELIRCKPLRKIWIKDQKKKAKALLIKMTAKQVLNFRWETFFRRNYKKRQVVLESIQRIHSIPLKRKKVLWMQKCNKKGRALPRLIPREIIWTLILLNKFPHSVICSIEVICKALISNRNLHKDYLEKTRLLSHSPPHFIENRIKTPHWTIVNRHQLSLTKEKEEVFHLIEQVDLPTEVQITLLFLLHKVKVF